MSAVEVLAAADADAAVALWQAAGLTRPWNDPHADFTRALAGPTSAVLGLRDGGALVATVMVGDDGHRGWVYYLAVDPARQRGGLGRLMMAAAEDWLAKRGCPKLNLMVRGDNTQARGFYARLGYDLNDVVTLAKRLD